jgi:hypothetical protein
MDAVEDVLMAYRYAYYCIGESIIPDSLYDKIEAEAKAILPNDSPIHQPGSSLDSSYSDEVKRIAVKLLGRAQMAIETKEEALKLAEQTRRALLEQVRVVFLKRLESGPCSVSDCRDDIVFPPGVNLKFLGAVHVPLVRDGKIEFVEYRMSQRADCHKRPVAVWRLKS